MTGSSDTDPSEIRTLGDMRNASKRLGLNCRYCSRFRYMGDRKYDDDVEVAAIAASLKCARCGSTDVETFVVSRDPKSGYWPAEGS